MTHREFSSTGPNYGAPIVLTAPGDVVAAVPACLGFTPEKSLVLIAFTGKRIVVVLRVDLDEDLRDNIGQIVAAVAGSGADSVCAVVVDADSALRPICAEDHLQLCEALAAELAAETIAMCGAFIVDAIARGGRWRCLDGCGSAGEVSDPAASPVTVKAVVSGRRIYDRRDDLRAVLASSDPTRSEALAGVIARCRNGVPVAQIGRAARGAAALLAAKGDLDDLRIAGLVLTLGHGSARDALCALAVETDAAALESLWVFLARITPQPWRVEVLVLVGFYAFARGDGPLAATALGAALDAAPGHRMAGMLDDALRAGVHPRQIRALAGAAQSY